MVVTDNICDMASSEAVTAPSRELRPAPRACEISGRRKCHWFFYIFFIMPPNAWGPGESEIEREVQLLHVHGGSIRYPHDLVTVRGGSRGWVGCSPLVSLISPLNQCCLASNHY